MITQCGNESVDTVHLILKQYYRVLKPKGTLIVVSYGLPDKRLKHFRHPNFKWEVRVEKAIKLRQATTEEHEVDGGPEPEFHYIYICVKVVSHHQNEEEAPKIVAEEPVPAPDDKKGAKDGTKVSLPTTQKKLGK